MPPRPSLPAARPNRPSTVGGPPHFALFGIPVRVGVGFWIMSVVLGLQSGLQGAIVWTLIVFVSVLFHELGHALVARAFGARPSITLHALGGLTFMDRPFSRGRSILVSLAGPFAGFLFGGLFWLVTSRLHLTEGQAAITKLVLFVNLGWGIVNLLPVVPFDGGHVLAAALGPRRAFLTAAISSTVGLGIAAASLITRGMDGLWIAFLFGTAGFSAVSQARVAWSQRIDLKEKLDQQLGKAKQALARGDLDDAFLLADDVVRRARTAPIRNGAWTTLAWVHVQRGEGREAREALVHIEPRGAIDPYTVAAVEDAAGEPRRARDLLDAARRAGFRNADATKLLIDLYARDGDLRSAGEIALADAEILPAADARSVVHALAEGGADRQAATLAGKLFELHGHVDDSIDEARALVRLGDRGGALDVLERILARNDRTGDSPFRTPEIVALLKGDPVLSTLAGEARFERLLAS